VGVDEAPLGARLNGQTAEEQAALRRVATLVARTAGSEVVFGAVAEEVAALFDADVVAIARREPGGERTIMSGHGLTHFEPGVRITLDPRDAAASARDPGRSARFDTDDPALADLPVSVRAEETPSSVHIPILVEGRTWGMISVGSRHGQLPLDTGQRLASFTELVAIAIAGAQARLELRRSADEQAALRRVAVLVARAAPPDEVFAAVTAEAGQVLAADVAILNRYGPDGTETVIGAWASAGAPPVAVGTRVPVGGRNVTSLVFETGRPARIDGYADATGAIGDIASKAGVRASVGVPVSVAGQLWGIMLVAARAEPLPGDTEARLTAFTELLATAIANAQARTELREFALEQAALRRVATLVARAAPSGDVFAAIIAEAGRLLDADITGMGRYDPDGTVTIVSTWASTGAAVPVPVGTRFAPGGHNAGTLVFQTGQPVRIDDFGEVTGPVAEPARKLIGARSAVTVPLKVAGRLWGTVSVASTHAALPAGTEARLARFTELAATAIANAEAQAALTASRARIVAAADAARRRIEQDLHDVARQRLVSLARQLKATQAAAPEAGELVQQLETAIAETNDVLEQLHEIAQGLHPSVLADGGLGRALTALASHSAIPVQLDVRVAGRLPEPTELTAYYAVSEALTNTAKHAHASAAEVAVEVAADQGTLRVFVRDDGRGGADSSRGSGLTGLRDRVEAVGGRLTLHSPPGAGTALEIVLPLQRTSPPAG
jgi:signal transduction histidine kinase